MSFEISSPKRYNVRFEKKGTTIGIGKGPNLNRFFDLPFLGFNDVLLVRGTAPNSSGIVRPRRVGGCDAIIQIQVGVLTDGEEQTPLLDGIDLGNTFAGVEIDVLGTNPPEFAFGGVTVLQDGLMTYGQTHDGEARGTRFYQGATSVDISVHLALLELNSGARREITKIFSRPTGRTRWDRLQNTARLVSEGDLSFCGAGFVPSWGAIGLNPGGTIFFDNVLLSGFSGTAEQPIIDTLNDSWNLEVSAIRSLETDPAKAEALLVNAISKLRGTKVDLAFASAVRRLQPSTRVNPALSELENALRADLDALDALREGKTTDAFGFLLKASFAKARAHAALQGHRPKRGRVPDGRGGHDLGDPIFSDGFEAGDVNAWAR